MCISLFIHLNKVVCVSVFTCQSGILLSHICLFDCTAVCCLFVRLSVVPRLFVGMFTLCITLWMSVCLSVDILRSLERETLMGRSLNGQLPRPNV